MAIDSTPEAERLQKLHNPLYWLGFNILNFLKKLVLKHKLFWGFIGVLILITAFVLRTTVQPMFITLRLHSFDVMLFLTIVIGLRMLKQKLAERGKRLRRLWKVTAFLLVIIGVRCEVYNYFALYCRRLALQEIDLKELPTTEHERIQPIESIRTLADGVMDQNCHPSEPDFVRIGSDYRFTMAVEPDTPMTRLVGTINEIIDIPGNSTSPDFSKDSRHQVKFSIGEHMFLGKNSHTAATKSLPLWRFFSYKTGDVKYVQDDSGEMVEVVCLTRLNGSWWSKWIFPWPEFGGVIVIRQNSGGVAHALKRLFFGEGKWIPPEKIKNYEYLRGQNLVPYEVSRYTARSFRFEQSFWSPFPGLSHSGDTMIPDVSESKNDMPYTIYAEFQKGTGKLYHYFALEPWQQSQHGLSDSLFFPADGIGQPLVFRHYKRDEGMHGVAAVDHQVRGSDIHVDWSHALPIEHRPWIHVVGGKKRLMWLTTIVTFKDAQKKMSASSTPNIVLTDARTGRTIWVKATKPEGWVAEVEKEFTDVIKN